MAIKKGMYVDNEKITFEGFVEKWLSDYANVNLQPKTLFEYRKLLTRINAALGHIKLIHLQPTHLTEFYNNLRENDIRKHDKSITNANSIHDEYDKRNYMLREVNFHGLRHTSATLLINPNTDISTVSKRLGHARISTTLNIYTHALQKSDRTAADKLENLFNKNKEVKNKARNYLVFLL